MGCTRAYSYIRLRIALEPVSTRVGRCVCVRINVQACLPACTPKYACVRVRYGVYAKLRLCTRPLRRVRLR